MVTQSRVSPFANRRTKSSGDNSRDGSSGASSGASQKLRRARLRAFVRLVEFQTFLTTPIQGSNCCEKVSRGATWLRGLRSRVGQRSWHKLPERTSDGYLHCLGSEDNGEEGIRLCATSSSLVGVVICQQCKVFKCVSFPDGADGY